MANLKPGEHQITVRLSEELYRAVKVKLAQEGHTLSWVIRKFLRGWTEGPSTNAEATESQQ